MPRIKHFNHKTNQWEYSDEASQGVTSWNDLKDRPFYSETTERVLIEQTAMFAEIPEAGISGFQCPIDCNFIVGEAYSVLWDGVEYTCVACNPGGNGVGLGNIALYPGGEPNTNEPFLMVLSDNVLMILTTSTGEHSFKVVGNVEEVHHLDTKYMPISYGVLVLPRINISLGVQFDVTPSVIDNAEKVWGYIKRAAEERHLIVSELMIPPFYCTQTPKHDDDEEYCYYHSQWFDVNTVKDFSLEFRYNTNTKQLSIIGDCNITQLATV